MSYHIYTTDALILSDSPKREADKIYAILTRDLGLIRASAGGVRKEESKLRAALEPFSLSTVSLVRGKEYWRLTSANLEKSVSTSLRGKKGGLESLVRVLSLLEKLVVGESAHPELFDTVREMIGVILNQENDDFAPEIEILFVARLLFELGYISVGEVEEGVLRNFPDRDLLRKVREEKKGIVLAINQGINSSGLGN